MSTTNPDGGAPAVGQTCSHSNCTNLGCTCSCHSGYAVPPVGETGEPESTEPGFSPGYYSGAVKRPDEDDDVMFCAKTAMTYPGGTQGRVRFARIANRLRVAPVAQQCNDPNCYPNCVAVAPERPNAGERGADADWAIGKLFDAVRSTEEGSCAIRIAARLRSVTPPSEDKLQRIHAIANEAFGEGDSADHYNALRDILDIVREPAAGERDEDAEMDVARLLIEYSSGIAGAVVVMEREKEFVRRIAARLRSVAPPDDDFGAQRLNCGCLLLIRELERCGQNHNYDYFAAIGDAERATAVAPAAEPSEALTVDEERVTFPYELLCSECYGPERHTPQCSKRLRHRSQPVAVAPASERLTLDELNARLGDDNFSFTRAAPVAETAEREMTEPEKLLHNLLSVANELDEEPGQASPAWRIRTAVGLLMRALAAPAPARKIETLDTVLHSLHERPAPAQPAGEAGPQYGKREEDALEIVQGLKDVERESLDLTGTDRVKLRRAIAWIEAHAGPAREDAP